MEEAVVAIVQDEPSGRDSLSSETEYTRFTLWVSSLADDLLERGILLITRCFISAIRIFGLDGLEVKHHLPPAFPKTPISFISGHHGDDLNNGLSRFHDLRISTANAYVKTLHTYRCTSHYVMQSATSSGFHAYPIQVD
jgi:hypothetical protein